MNKNFLYILFVPAIILGITGTSNSITTKTFIGTIVDGPLQGQTGTGSFTYNEDLVVDAYETLYPAQGLTVSFTFMGQDFNETNDIDFDDYPILEFDNFNPDVLDYMLEEGVNNVDFIHPSLFALQMNELFDSEELGFDYEIDIFPTYVPIPSSVFLFVSGLIGIVGIRRKLKR